MEPFILISGSCNLFQEGWNGCGIYCVSGLAPSSFQTPIYIGSAGDFKKRIVYRHLPELNNNDHINKPLQRYFNIHGMENIVVWNIENCEPEKLLETEQKWIDYYGTVKDLKAFNISPIAGRPLSRKGMKSSEETKRRIGEASRGRKHSEESKRKIREIRTGTKQSEETKRKIGELQKLKGNGDKPFRILSPDGILFEGDGLAKFCREKGLDSHSLGKVVRGSRKSHKGWTKPPEITNNAQ